MPVLIERSPGERDLVCGGFLGWDAIAALRRLGLDPAHLGAVPIGRLRLVSGRRIVEADLPEGHKLFAMNCALCHGTDAVSGQAAGPDLRESAIALDGDAFWSVLHEGVLRQRGMPRFAGLTRAEADKIRNYLRAASREALGTRKPTAYPSMNFGGS